MRVMRYPALKEPCDSPEPVDGLQWLEEVCAGHHFGGASQPYHNNNLNIAVEGAVQLSFGPGAVIELPKGSEVTVYYRYDSAKSGHVVALFVAAGIEGAKFSPGGRLLPAARFRLYHGIHGPRLVESRREAYLFA